MKRSTTLTAGLAAVAMTGGLLTGMASAGAAPSPGVVGAPDKAGDSTNPDVHTLNAPKAGAGRLVKRRDVNGRATSVRPSTALPAPAAVASTAKAVTRKDASARSVAAAQLKRVAPYFGARPGDMKAGATSRADGDTTVRFQQRVDGVPVYGGQIVTNLDKKGALESASGEVTLSTYGSFPRTPRSPRPRGRAWRVPRSPNASVS